MTTKAYVPALAPSLERLLEQQVFPVYQAEAREVLAAGKWGEYFRRFNAAPEDRLPAFEAMAPAMSDEDYWQYLGVLWVFHDRVHDRLARWRRLFRSPRPAREHLMREHERERFRALPERLTVYRGFCVHGGENGISWADSYDFALAFAERWAANFAHVADMEPGGLFVASVTIPRSRVLACFEREGGMAGVELVVPDLRGYRRRIADAQRVK